MPTNLALDDDLIAEAVRVGGHRSKKDAVNAALREYIRQHKRQGILSMFGKVEYDPDYNYKALRRGKRR